MPDQSTYHREEDPMSAIERVDLFRVTLGPERSNTRHLVPEGRLEGYRQFAVRHRCEVHIVPTTLAQEEGRLRASYDLPADQEYYPQAEMLGQFREEYPELAGHFEHSGAENRRPHPIPVGGGVA